MVKRSWVIDLIQRCITGPLIAAFFCILYQLKIGNDSRMYFTIDTTTTPRIIGKGYPQMECINISVEDGLDVLSENKGKRVDDLPAIFNLRLPKTGKLTDVISCSLGAGGDFIISERLYNILQQHQATTVQYFPLTFEHKGESYRNYKWVHFIYELEKFIDFGACEYNDHFIRNINSRKPNGYSEFKELVVEHKKFNHFRLAKTVLQQSFPHNEDLFVLSFANQDKYISMRLLDRMIEEKITGLEIKPATHLMLGR